MKHDKYKPGDLVRYSPYASHKWRNHPIIIIEGRESFEYPTYKIYDILDKDLTWETENMLVPINETR